MNHYKKLATILLFCGLVFWLPISLAQTVSSDQPYSVVEEFDYHYIFSQSHSADLPKAIELNHFVKHLYRQSFDWSLQERASLVLASPRNQIANGFATVTPNTETFFYPSGFPLLDAFASPYWYPILMAHESAHLYQLDSKGKIPSLLKKFVGNPLVITIPFVGLPIFIHPNQWTPGFLIEGNAVMNESRFGIGGRLHSGEVRALVLSQIKHGQVNATRLFNDHLDFPFYTEKYLQGGYLFAYLAQKYGVDHANRFFKEQGEHFINPLILNDTFRRHFGISYNQAIREYTFDLQPLAQAQKSLPTESLITSFSLGPMNADEKKIWFLTQPTFVSPPWLVEIDKTTGHYESTQVDLPNGKVFWIDNEPYSVSTQAPGLSKIRYALYGEGLKFYSPFESKIVQDFRANTWLSVDARDNFFSSPLLLNDQEMGETHSSAVLSRQGEPIFFKQAGDTRTLWKGDQSLFSYRGYYGRPLEELKNGAILFIAATEFGSSLFQWTSDTGIQRLSDSDVIVDARHLQGDQFVVAEVSANAYAYKTFHAQPTNELPFLYKYEFESRLLASKMNPPDSSDKENASGSTDSSLHLRKRDYWSLGDLRYSASTLSGGYSTESGYWGAINTSFVDPLFYNALNLSLAYYDDELSGSVTYFYRRYLLSPFVGYAASEEEYLTSRDTTESLVDQAAMAGFELPLFRWRRWSGGWVFTGFYDKTDYPRYFEETLEGINSFSLTYMQSYPLSYSPYRFFNLNLTHQLISDLHTGLKEDSVLHAKATLSGDLGRQNYLTLDLTSALAEADNLKLTHRPYNASEIEVYRLKIEKSVLIQKMNSVELTYKRPFSVSYYFPRFPFSLRRLAPYGKAGTYHLEEKTGDLVEDDFQDFEIGVEFEALFAHKIPVILKTSAQMSSLDDEDEAFYSLSFSSNF